MKQTEHELYSTWKNMKERCLNPNNKDYDNYGGRGISVDKKWLEHHKGFLNFLSDMGERPSKEHTLDRKDNSIGYNKENCRWATWHEQNSNRKDNNKTVGVRYDPQVNRYKARIILNGVCKSKSFKTEHEAISFRKELEKKYIK